MLEALFQIHDYLVAHSEMPIRRKLMDEIDWSDRLIAIKGARGVGKTDFLLQRAKEIEATCPMVEDDKPRRKNAARINRPCLYVNFNNFYFTEHSMVELASSFVKSGGQYLLLDQVFMYPNWSKELRRCHDKFRELHIIFSASSVMRLVEENRDLADVVKMYNLRGFSFREYLNLQTGLNLESYTLAEVVKSHCSISHEICEKVNPLPYFHEYLRCGYYPSYREKKDYATDLMKMMNTMLSVDILIIKQIDSACLPKLRKLLNILLREAPCALNISSISEAIEMSRATTMNYIKYLKDARLLNLLYMEGKSFPMKPVKVYMQNTNLAHMVLERELSTSDMYETYFYHALHAVYKVNATERNAMYVVDGKYYFDVYANASERDSIRPCAIGNLETGRGNYIPLWLLGFLY